MYCPKDIPYEKEYLINFEIKHILNTSKIKYVQNYTQEQKDMACLIESCRNHIGILL